MRISLRKLVLPLCFFVSASVFAEPFAAPGDSGLRHDLRLLDDAGLINIPLAAWPVSWQNVAAAIDTIEIAELDQATLLAFTRIRARVSRELKSTRFAPRAEFSGAITPPVIRTFEDTPREEGAIGIGAGWQSGQLFLNLQASTIANPADDDRYRLDGSYVGGQWGNWLISAGWQERWWGPGSGGSLILSTNARPVPAVSIQRVQSTPFRSRWLRWVGPWTFTGFVGQFEDERVINNALLMGMRLTFRPIQSIEIGLSRTAQLCGDGRTCTASTIADSLLGRDNRGVNVSPEDEPGNQLAGIDLRWRLPGSKRLAIYWQWIAEDTRRGGPELGSWLRMGGLEHWGRIGEMQHRSFFEVADTTCRDGGLGFSEAQPDCGYEHGIYRTGYRHHGRSLGYGTDGDGLSYSIGSTLVQSAGHRWGFVARFAEINRIGEISMSHTLSADRVRHLEVIVSHQREILNGSFGFGVGYQRDERTGGAADNNDPIVYIKWQSVYASDSSN